MTQIASIRAYQIFDSRGYPTVEVELTLASGMKGRGVVPAGASTGQFEAHELRDGDPAKFRGRSVFRAIEHVEGEIADAVRGRDVMDQRGIDELMIELDGTPNKSRLGANAILGVSLAAVDAAARTKGVPIFELLGEGSGTLLPLPEIQLIGGGAHSHWRIDVQDFMLVAVGARTYAETLEITHNVYHALGDLLAERGLRSGIADEGGYWPTFDSNEAALRLCVEAIERAGYTPGDDAAISLDIAASDLYHVDSGRYAFALEQQTFTSDEFADLLAQWTRRYPIVSIEDPLADTDWPGWNRFRQRTGDRLQIIGDDLFTTNVARIRDGVREGVANAVLIKLNQIGTVSETLDAIRVTQQSGWLPVVSARSGETEDAFIAHLAVGTNAGQLKVGSFARSERMAKWNEVLRIAHALGERATFIGGKVYETLGQPSLRSASATPTMGPLS